MEFLEIVPYALFVLGAVVGVGGVIAAAWSLSHIGIKALNQSRPWRQVGLLCASLLVTQVVGHWRYIRSLPDGIRSRDWPSVEAKVARIHDRFPGYDVNGLPLVVLDMPYLYAVDGEAFRGSRFDVSGFFAGSNREILALTRDEKNFRAYYNPARPEQCVLVPGPIKFSFNRRTLLPSTIFGLLLSFALLKCIRPDSLPPSLPAARGRPHVALSVVVGSLALAFVVSEAIRYINTNFPMHSGSMSGYNLIREAPMDDGIEYAILVGYTWSPREIDEPPGLEWLLDLRDTQFIAADGSLKDITRRKWSISQTGDFYRATRLPKKRGPDWIMTWTAETGIQTAPFSQRAIQQQRQIQKNKERDERHQMERNAFTP